MPLHTVPNEASPDEAMNEKDGKYYVSESEFICISKRANKHTRSDIRPIDVEGKEMERRTVHLHTTARLLLKLVL